MLQIKSGNIKGAESDKQYLPFEELKALILEKQKIIFSDVSTKSEIEEANIQLEKLMVEYEKCPEVVAEKEAKRAQEEKLNLMALNKCTKFYTIMNLPKMTDSLYSKTFSG